MVRVGSDRIVVACADRPGLFSRVAGVLALDGLDVVEAAARSLGDHAVEDFRVVSATGGAIKWDMVVRDLSAALDDRLALSARLAERARTYRRRPRSGRTFEPAVRFDNEMSDDATVIEVVGPDTVGLLHRVTAALAELGCNIRTAKISTIGPDAVDSFYVRNRGGGKILDPGHLAEIRRALTHAIEALGAEVDTTLAR